MLNAYFLCLYYVTRPRCWHQGLCDPFELKKFPSDFKCLGPWLSQNELSQISYGLAPHSLLQNRQNELQNGCHGVYDESICMSQASSSDGDVPFTFCSQRLMNKKNNYVF